MVPIQALSTAGGAVRLVASSVHSHLNAALTVLSYLAGGAAAVCPPAGRLGAPHSREQLVVIRRLKATVMPWMRAPSVDAVRYPKLKLLESSWHSLR